jgi:hypothetical protein
MPSYPLRVPPAPECDLEDRDSCLRGQTRGWFCDAAAAGRVLHNASSVAVVADSSQLIRYQLTYHRARAVLAKAPQATRPPIDTADINA